MFPNALTLLVYALIESIRLTVRRVAIAIILAFVMRESAFGQGGPPMITDDPGTPGTDESDTSGAENIWDAPWYVFGAIAATTSRTDKFTGLDLAQGMLRIQNANGTEYAVGGEDIDDVVDKLADGDSINYIGTMGPPVFDSSGARTGSGSVWCVTNVTSTPPVQQLADVLRVDPGSDAASHADDVLVGDGFMSCNPDF